jgi:hypothetical protein
LAATCAANAAPILSEGFDNIATLGGSGWTQTNNSTPGGATGWFQGNPGVFGSASGAADSYIAANFLNAGAGGDISNWLISPTLSIGNSTQLTFFTRSNGSDFQDQLEVRFSANGASGNVGGTTASVGDFTTLLLAINPLLNASYPSAGWASYTVILPSVVSGRFAFRYLAANTDLNGDYIGIDSVTVAVPEPSTLALFGLSLLALVGITRRRLQTRSH